MCVFTFCPKRRKLCEAETKQKSKSGRNLATILSGISFFHASPGRAGLWFIARDTKQNFKLPSICKRKIHKINIFVSAITTRLISLPFLTFQFFPFESFSNDRKVLISGFNFPPKLSIKTGKLAWKTFSLLDTSESTKLMTTASGSNCFALNMKLGQLFIHERMFHCNFVYLHFNGESLFGLFSAVLYGNENKT